MTAKQIYISLCYGVTLVMFIASPIMVDAKESPHVIDSEKEIVEKSILAAADTFLNKLHTLLSTSKTDFGFLADDNIDAVLLGKPFQLYAMRDESILAYKEKEPLLKYLEQTNRWFVPVLVSTGKTRALIEVVKNNTGQWQGTGLGWAPLARKWKKINTFWNEEGKPLPLLVMSYSIPGYFFTVPYQPKPNLTSLATLKADDIIDEALKPKLEDAWSVISQLRNTIKSSRQDGNSGS